MAGEAMGATVGFSIYPADGGTAPLLLTRADTRMRADKPRSQSVGPTAEPALEATGPADAETTSSRARDKEPESDLIAADLG